MIRFFAGFFSGFAAATVLSLSWVIHVAYWIAILAISWKALHG